jgi:hypothetical protein
VPVASIDVRPPVVDPATGAPRIEARPAFFTKTAKSQGAGKIVGLSVVLQPIS